MNMYRVNSSRNIAGSGT